MCNGGRDLTVLANRRLADDDTGVERRHANINFDTQEQVSRVHQVNCVENELLGRPFVTNADPTYAAALSR